MTLENYQISKVRKFATHHHVGFHRLQELLEECGVEFPSRGQKHGELYHHIKSGYKYITMYNLESGCLELWNISGSSYNFEPHFSSLDVDHEAIADGWPED